MSKLTAWLSQGFPLASLRAVLRSILRGEGGMTFPATVSSFILILGLGLLAAPASAQVGGLYWQCQAPSSSNPNGGYCPAGLTYPLPVTGAIIGGGASTYRSVALTSTALAVKTSPGSVSFLHVANLESMAVTCYVHLYDTALASTTVGTTVPKWSMVLAAGTIQTVPFSVPLSFTTAITVAATTTAGGSTACSPILTLTEIAYR